MTAIGNELSVSICAIRQPLSRRRRPRAVASPAALHYDQLMLLQPPRLRAPSLYPIYKQ